MASRLRFILDSVDNTKKGIQSAEKNLGNLSDGLNALQGTAIAGAVIAAGKLTWEMGQMGAQSLRTGRAFEAISGGTAMASDNLKAMRDATRGAMSETEMMAQASTMLQMGIAKNADGLGEMTEMATRLGAAMGTKAGPALENWNMMIANQSLPRLDTFGIASGKVRVRIDELTASIKGMTREDAFMIAVKEQGAIAMERLGDAAADEMLAFEQLSASVENLKTTIAEKAAPAVSQFAGTLNLLLTWNDRLAEATASHADEVLNTAESYDEYRARIEQIAKAQGAVITAEGNLVKKHQEIDAATGMVINETEDLVQANFALSEATWRVLQAEKDGIPIVDGWMASMAAAKETVVETAVPVIEATDALSLLTETLDGSNLAAESMVWNQELMAEALGITTTAQQQAQLDAELLAQAYSAGTISAGELREKLTGLAQGTLELSESEREAIQSELRTIDATQKLARAHDDAALAAAGQAETTMGLASSLKDAASSQIANQLSGMLDPKKMGAEAYTEAVTQIGLQFGTMDEKSIALSGNMSKLAEAIETGIIPAEDADEALAALIEDAEDGEVNFGELQRRFEDIEPEIGQLDNASSTLAVTTDRTKAATDRYIHSMDNLYEGALRTRMMIAGLNDEIEDYNANSGGSGEGSGNQGSTAEYQHGGVVPGPVGQPQLAIVHGGETILPTHKATMASNASAGNTYVYNIQDKWTGAAMLDDIRRREDRDIFYRV